MIENQKIKNLQKVGDKKINDGPHHATFFFYDVLNKNVG